MKKKNFLILFFILFLTGCSCEYNLNINGISSFEENITIKENKQVIEDNIIKKIVPDTDIFECTSMYDLDCKTRAFETEKDYYISSYIEGITSSMFLSGEFQYNPLQYTSILEQSRADDTNNYGVSYKNNFSLSNIEESILKEVAEDYTLENKNGILYFKLNKIHESLINKVDSIIVNIRVSYPVISNNADKVTDMHSYKIYTWSLDKENTKTISLDINTNVSTNEPSNNKHGRYIIIVIIVIISILSFLFIYKKSKNK